MRTSKVLRPRSRRWVVFRVCPEPLERTEDGAAIASRVSTCLFGLGATAVEESSGGLVAWLEAPASSRVFVRDALDRIRGAAAGPVRASWRWERDADWSAEWRRSLRPRRVGRVVIAPSWSEPESEEREVVVRLDPGTAFGTGEHGSTRSAIGLLQDVIRTGDRVLDLGTGSGILAIVAAKLGARVIAIERDPAAARAARRNAGENGESDAVRVVELSVDEPTLRLLGDHQFDVVACNIERSFAEPLLPALAGLCKPAGWLVVAGILAEEAEVMIRRARDLGLVLEDRLLDDGWWAGLLTSGSRIA